MSINPVTLPPRRATNTLLTILALEDLRLLCSFFSKNTRTFVVNAVALHLTNGNVSWVHKLGSRPLCYHITKLQDGYSDIYRRRAVQQPTLAHPSPLTFLILMVV
jgi:hypothetical protein